MSDYYKILGINRNAAANDIKKAYRRLAMDWHPDRHTENKRAATEKFKRISEAYSVLSDPEKKRTYDRHGKKGLSGETFNKQQAQNVFESFFKNGAEGMAEMMNNPGAFGGMTTTTTTGTSTIKVNVNGKDVEVNELKDMGIDLSDLGVIGGFDFGAFFGGKPGQKGKQSATVNGAPQTNIMGNGFQQNHQQNFFQQNEPEDQPENVSFDLDLKLDEFYTGTTRKFRINRNVVCTDCDGTGSKTKTQPNMCIYCNGRGFQVLVKTVRGMTQKHQTTCLTCEGLATDIEEDDKCPKCKGMRTMRQSKKLKITVKQGTRSGTKITFEGLGDEVPGKNPGDLIVVLREIPHETFIRRGNDAVCKKSITLQEALCGYEFTLDYLDGETKVIKSEPNEVVRPGSRRRIERWGFPWPTSPDERGGLVIEWDVHFPKTLTPEIKDKIRPFLEGTVTIEDRFKW